MLAALKQTNLDQAVSVLERVTREGQVTSAVLHVQQADISFTRAFGKVVSENAMFLLGSISKPINVTAVMTLFDQGKFQLDDRLFGADLRPYRLNGHGLLGRPCERNHLRRAHGAAAPRGAAPPA